MVGVNDVVNSRSDAAGQPSVADFVNSRLAFAATTVRLSATETTESLA